MEQLKACYEHYLEEAEMVKKNRPFLEGVFGFGSSAKDHPCHTIFLETVEKWVEAVVQEGNREKAEFGLRYMVQTSETDKEAFSYWTMFAAHGLARPLVDLVSPQVAGEMRAWYDQNLPRWERLPVHRDLYKKLKKREKA
jgi:hypothetical protein